MNAVEIEEAVYLLSRQEFNPQEFPFDFLAAFGNKPTTIKKLRGGSTNKSDLNGVLQRNNIHIKTCKGGEVDITLKLLKESLETKKAKSKFILATDGSFVAAENLYNGEILACSFKDLADYFGFFLSLAGIKTIDNLNENSFDIRATGRLNKLYLELLKINPEWGKDEKRNDMNHFMIRIVFCFFAEDTNIFGYDVSFTNTIERMSQRDSENTHEIIFQIFRAMNVPIEERGKYNLPRWANVFPYVNGGLFSENIEVPKFSKIARSYLIHIGNLDWTKINPDIFGSMIQAVAEDEERGFLGMHYTSVPNILKVLNPLFLNNLREKVKLANNDRKLLSLRKRISKIRVFDPACGSGNFLVIAYKEMRKIEDEINSQLKEIGRKSDIPLTNFRGIEIRPFSAEIARLALIIAQYQCDVIYLGQKEALSEFLPLESNNWITCGNSLRMDWLNICPPSGKKVKNIGDDLFNFDISGEEIEFDNDGGEVYVCGNPPYQGSVNQSIEQKEDMRRIFSKELKTYKDLDYVSAFVLKAAEFNKISGSSSALVTTNSITQGEQVGMLWPIIFKKLNHIFFAYTSFLWSNLAIHKAAVTCVIIGLTAKKRSDIQIFSEDTVKRVELIGPYLIPGTEDFVIKRTKAIHDLSSMSKGNQATDGKNLLMNMDEYRNFISRYPTSQSLIREYIGSYEFIRSTKRYCFWIDDSQLNEAQSIPELDERIERVRKLRIESKGKQANQNAHRPHRFVFAPHTNQQSIIIPRVFSERRKYLTVGFLRGDSQVIADSASAIYNANLVDFAILSSKLQLVWVDLVAGRLNDRYRYSNTLVWNTFPIPQLTKKNKTDISRCAENILLARESHFPASISELYDPEKMPENLIAAHSFNDEIIERIYIGRKFKNNTERREKLFKMYKSRIDTLNKI